MWKYIHILQMLWESRSFVLSIIAKLIYIYIYTFDLFISIKILLALFSNSFCTRAIYFAIIIKMLLNIQKEKKKKINKYNTFIVKISISRFLFFIYTYKHTCDLSWLPEGERREGKTIAKKDVEDKDRITTMRTRVITFV